MELRKRKNNYSYNDTSKLNETENSKSEEQTTSIKSTKNNNNNKRKRTSDSDYEYTSTTESKSVTSTDSKASSKQNRKKRNKKKLEVYNVDSDDSDDDILKKSSYDPIIQQKVTIATPLRIMKKIKFNNTLNEVIDLVGDSDEETEIITILDSDDDKEILVKNTNLTKNNSNKRKKQNNSRRYNNNNNNSTIFIDLSGEEEEKFEVDNGKSAVSLNKRNLRSSSKNKSKSELVKSENDSTYNTRNRGKKYLSDEDEIKSDDYNNNRSKRQKKTNNPDNDDDYSSSNSISNNSSNKNHKNYKNNDEPKHDHNLRNHSKAKSDSVNYVKLGEKNRIDDEESVLQRKNEVEKSTRTLRSNDVKTTSMNSVSSSKNTSDTESRNDSYNGESSIIHDLESMNIDDLPSGNIDSIEISSDDSDDDVLEIVSNNKDKYDKNEIEISDDENNRSSKRKKSLRNNLPESSMKKSIESRSSRIRKKNENRSLALKRLKERKVNEYRNIVDNEKNSEEENLSTVRNFFQDNDDFVVSDSGSEEVYFLTTKWDIKQRKKLYKAFKRLYKFCIAILVHEEYIKKNINELKKAFQIINKRINNVCKRITPVPPWINKFQADIDSYPHFTVNSEYPKLKCDSCRKSITSSFAVSFSGRKYNKLSLKETNDKPLKDKERVYTIDRVCLERVQIYHELYHFRYNTLKEVKSKMLENNIHIDEYRKSKDENRVEDIFAKLKVNCKELYVKLSEKLKNGEKYVPNTLDI